ncbi:hypothetical protein [Lacipirellula parvula]|uniref:PEP-CTERM protein-sorting domain-containing protein n=1 Tax=Lacipirellula parvula TaxID=2650471 RepID=A0A5K7X4A2_9BACT|nr:hypothetical protein [Lacipirellula parvula]BBO31215.1 hypothetical protein PLANPX_0827 [Lacipirellula parvula]
MRHLFCGALAITLAGASLAQAALTANDPFNYTTGDLTGKNSGVGWAGAYTDTGNSTVIETAGLSYGGLPTTPGSVRTADGGAATTISFRTLSNTYGDGETETWVSFLGRRNGTTASNLFAGVSFYNTNGTATADGEVSFASSVNSATPVWRVLDLGGSTASESAVAITPNAVHFLVARIVWNVADPNLGGTGTSAVYLYVNPTAGQGLPAAASAGRNITMTNFNKIRFAGQNAIDYSFDDIRIGDTFADVAPFLAPNADFNNSGSVTIDDFNVLKSNFLTGTALAQGDANYDGKVDHADFFLWRTAFVTAGGSLEGLSLSIPEPSSAAIAGSLGLMAYGIGLVRRR